MIDRFDLSYVARAFCRFYIGKLFPFPKKYITVEENPQKTPKILILYFNRNY